MSSCLRENGPQLYQGTSLQHCIFLLHLVVADTGNFNQLILLSIAEDELGWRGLWDF